MLLIEINYILLILDIKMYFLSPPQQVPEMVEGQIASSMGEMQVVPEPCEADSAPGLTPSKPGQWQVTDAAR